jgi:MYXO-CTERM domain-containing protein
MKCTVILRGSFVMCVVAWLLPIAASQVQAVTFTRDPMQGAGFVEVEGGLPIILGAPVSSPLEVDIVFTDMQHIQLMDGATTTVEFGIGNTGNTANLDYRIVFDLSDMAGNLITTDALVVQNTVQGGFIQVINLDLTPLPPVIFHDMHVRVEASFAGPNTGAGRFDLFMAGGAGSSGTGVSGPIRFNRAVVGVWVPEPTAAGLGLLGLACLLLHRRSHIK